MRIIKRKTGNYNYYTDELYQATVTSMEFQPLHKRERGWAKQRKSILISQLVSDLEHKKAHSSQLDSLPWSLSTFCHQMSDHNQVQYAVIMWIPHTHTHTHTHK